jgi:hypothetical protein
VYQLLQQDTVEDAEIDLTLGKQGKVLMFTPGHRITLRNVVIKGPLLTSEHYFSHTVESVEMTDV